jgi:predicted Zn-dependent peptidase
MKNLFLIGLFASLLSLQAQIRPAANTGKSADGKYSYSYWTGDPTAARIYTLSNGLTVYLSVNTSEPAIMTFIAVRAGSKHDPSDATGLAHYLEHMLFKGTDRYGSTDFSAESRELAVIEGLYEQYNKTTDAGLRKSIYKQIDSVSLLASRYAIANEYDKMVSSIGAKSTNAYTSVEQTVYMNKIPANQLERWLMIESERFRNPVMRLFHTELEAVYEEKNISLDSDQNKVFETLMANMFPNHTYGTQTTIGTVEHLKNPSLVRIREYLEKYYVPNNMAICLAGDLNPDETIALIEKHLGKWESKPVAPFRHEAEEAPLQEIIEKTVKGPDAGNVMLGYRLPGMGHPDYPALVMCDMILSNQSAGLIDLNLTLKQRVLQAYSGIEGMQDYSISYLGAIPREGQTLQEAKELLMEQIQALRDGNFSDGLLSAIVNNMEIEDIKKYQNSEARAQAFVDAYTTHLNWYDYIALNEKMAKITKEDIQRIANTYFGKGYITVYKEVGKDENVTKVEKPEITPVEVNRDIKSPFHEKILNTASKDINPLFLNYDQDIKKIMAGKVQVNYLKNTENQLYNIYYILDMGSENDRKLALAVQYLQYLGTKDVTAADLASKMFALGCEFGVSAGNDQVYVYLTGTDKTFPQALQLFELLLANAVPDEDAYREMVAGILKERADSKLNKRTIMFSALLNYGLYGERNPFLNILSETELAEIEPQELCNIVKGLTSYEHRILYYGPRETADLIRLLNEHHQVPATLKPVPQANPFVMQSTDQPKVLFVHYDMVQAELIWLSRSNQTYDPSKTATISLYNEYFGGGMGSVVFQTIRESKALAYSTFASYRIPSKKDEYFSSLAYVGTQVDKLKDAKTAMMELLNEMPESEVLLKSAQEGLRNKIASERIIRTGILMNYEAARKKGVNYDLRKEVYDKTPGMTMANLRDFHNQEIKNSTKILLVMGSRDKIDLKELEQYGPVKEVTLEEIFGY